MPESATLKAELYALLYFSKSPNVEKLLGLKAKLKNEKKGLKRDLDRYPTQTFLKDQLKDVKKSLKQVKKQLSLFRTQHNN